MNDRVAGDDGDVGVDDAVAEVFEHAAGFRDAGVVEMDIGGAVAELIVFDPAEFFQGGLAAEAPGDTQGEDGEFEEEGFAEGFDHAEGIDLVEGAVVGVAVGDHDEAAGAGFEFAMEVFEVFATAFFGNVAEGAEGEEVIEMVIGEVGAGEVGDFEIFYVGGVADVLPEVVVLGGAGVEAPNFFGAEEAAGPGAAAGADFEGDGVFGDVGADAHEVGGVEDADVAEDAVAGAGHGLEGIALVVAAVPDILEDGDFFGGCGGGGRGRSGGGVTL